jgi:hypothetical protein
MNIINLMVASSFFINGGIYFSSNLNPGFGIGGGKYLKNFEIPFKFKSFNLEGNANFSIFSSGLSFPYKFFKNFSTGISIFYSFIKLKKNNLEEIGGTISFSTFLKIYSENERFGSGFEFEFLKGEKQNIFLIGFLIELK